MSKITELENIMYRKVMTLRDMQSLTSLLRFACCFRMAFIVFDRPDVCDFRTYEHICGISFLRLKLVSGFCYTDNGNRLITFLSLLMLLDQQVLPLF